MGWTLPCKGAFRENKPPSFLELLSYWVSAEWGIPGRIDPIYLPTIEDKLGPYFLSIEYWDDQLSQSWVALIELLSHWGHIGSPFISWVFRMCMTKPLPWELCYWVLSYWVRAVWGYSRVDWPNISAYYWRYIGSLFLEYWALGRPKLKMALIELLNDYAMVGFLGIDQSMDQTSR